VRLSGSGGPRSESEPGALLGSYPASPDLRERDYGPAGRALQDPRAPVIAKITFVAIDKCWLPPPAPPGDRSPDLYLAKGNWDGRQFWFSLGARASEIRPVPRTRLRSQGRVPRASGRSIRPTARQADIARLPQQLARQPLSVFSGRQRLPPVAIGDAVRARVGRPGRTVWFFVSTSPSAPGGRTRNFERSALARPPPWSRREA